MTFPLFTRRAAIAGLGALTGSGVLAQAPFPSQPIRILVAFAAGGIGDLIARAFAQPMSEILHTPVLVENRPGANQMVAIRMLLNAPPDGYTLFLAGGSTMVQNPGVRKDPGYDPLKDFTLIGMMDTVPGVIIVDAGVPTRSVAELVAHARERPGKLNYASAGAGSAAHLAGEVFLDATGLKMTHVPYKADAEVLREMMAGNVQVAITPVANAIPHIQSGKLRALAVTTPARLGQLPEVPTLAETGIQALAGLEPHTFHCLVGPAGMPAAVTARLNETINRIASNPEFAQRLRTRFVVEPVTSTPQAFRSFVEKELAKWKHIGTIVKITD